MANSHFSRQQPQGDEDSWLKQHTTQKKMGDVEKLAQIATKTYKEQCIWFLNAFWPQFGDQAEKIWVYKHTFDDLDHDKHAEGSALDELQAHRFLEKHNETLTVQAMREKLRATGAIGASVRLVPLIHVLIFKYGADWHYLVSFSFLILYQTKVRFNQSLLILRLMLLKVTRRKSLRPKLW